MADSQARVLVESRQWLTGRARGATLEIGVGGWPSLPHYPAGLDLTGLDLRRKAVVRARQAVTRANLEATVVEGDAMALPFSASSFDTVVFSFSLCGVPSVEGALLEGLRVLRPGGALLMADHVESTWMPLRGFQRALETFTRPMFGEHFTRRPSVVARSGPISPWSCPQQRGSLASSRFLGLAISTRYMLSSQQYCFSFCCSQQSYRFHSFEKSNCRSFGTIDVGTCINGGNWRLCCTV